MICGESSDATNLISAYAMLPCPIYSIHQCISIPNPTPQVIRVYPTHPNRTPTHPQASYDIWDRDPYHHARISISSPHPNTTTFVDPLSLANISRTSSALYFLVTTFLTASPLFSLSSSCALIQHFAIRLCAISTPPGKPALTLPPSHQGFWTRSKEWRSVVRGRAAEETRWEEA